MPYIRPRDRAYVLSHRSPGDAGEFNFLVSTMCQEYINFYGLSYSVLNTLIGALECTKLELYRRMAAPYEDKKIAENGDVYEVTS